MPLSFSDREKFERLEKIFDDNYRQTRMWADYLNLFPELITPDMIAEITADGDVAPELAIAAIIAEAFGVDTDKDRAFFRNYIANSIKILDVKKYGGDAYSRAVGSLSARLGKWEIKEESYPAYRAITSSDIVFNPDFSERIELGFFTEKFNFPAILEDGNEWMTLAPIDVDTVSDAILAARGKVVTFGLGLGYYTYMAARRPEVSSVTAVEIDENAISLFKNHILPRLDCKDKIKIVHADAFEYAEHIMPGENFDFAFVDTWRDASDGAPMYLKMKKCEKLNPKTKFSYWIENFIISRLRSLRFEEFRALYKSGRLDLLPNTFAEIVAKLAKEELANHEFKDL